MPAKGLSIESEVPATNTTHSESPNDTAEVLVSVELDSEEHHIILRATQHRSFLLSASLFSYGGRPLSVFLSPLLPLPPSHLLSEAVPPSTLSYRLLPPPLSSDRGRPPLSFSRFPPISVEGRPPFTPSSDRTFPCVLLDSILLSRRVIPPSSLSANLLPPSSSYSFPQAHFSQRSATHLQIHALPQNYQDIK
ncbi:hypothetical protein SCHPADRAFT_250354 [Schizopora paradoxa]|uniref:Uncharacterized protein n=1 Tax=Schizopora paradoxa TaxID=27342 RepID=A0A0H2S1K6_9AGAM|nr:hypothetical protein SCHPADRAFT_250354 [Schizopora paradoxa]